MLRFLNAVDRAAAGERYESLRRRLLIVFAARRSGGDTSALADETLDRVARRLHQGIALESSVESYALGVARNVAREQWKAPREVELATPIRLIAAPESVASEKPVASECLEKCLEQVQARTREWVLRFYTGSGGAKIEARKRLAGELGLDLNALRVRMFRIRAKLEDCVRDCINTAGRGNDSRKGAIE